MDAARSAEQQLLLAISETPGPNAADSAETSALTAAAATAIAASSVGAVVMGGADTSATIVGGIGLEIEKGPSPDALKLEELKAELQTVAAAKKKASRTTASRWCLNAPGYAEPIENCCSRRSGGRKHYHIAFEI